MERFLETEKNTKVSFENYIYTVFHANHVERSLRLAQ